MAAILNFQILRKNCKTQKCLYLENRDRAISMEFLTHRLSLQSSYPNFQKLLVSPKMAAILTFSQFFAKIAKHKSAYILKTVLDRAISTKFLTHRVSLQSSHPNFVPVFKKKFTGTARCYAHSHVNAPPQLSSNVQK